MVGDAAEDEETEGSCSIYVKNLAFATGDAQLKKHFEKARHGVVAPCCFLVVERTGVVAGPTLRSLAQSARRW